MSYYTAVGSKVLYSTTFGPKKTVTGITNTDPAVASSIGHGITNGQMALLLNGWDDANEAVWKAENVAANTLQLGGLDASDTDMYPSGSSSAGSLQVVTDWQEIGQILEINPNGGGVRNITVSPLARRNAFNLPAGFEAAGMDLVLGYDPARVDQKNMEKLSRKLGAKIAFQIILPGGAKIFAYGTMSKSGIPQIASQDVIKVNLSINFNGMVTSYVDE